MLQSELSDLLDAAVTARTSRKSSERRQLRALTGHLEPAEFRVLLELVEQRSQWLEYHDCEDWMEDLDLAGFFPVAYDTLQANMRPTRRDSVSRAMTKRAVTLAMRGLEGKGLILRQRGGDGQAYKYRLELDLFEAREPVDGDAARHDVRVMMSEAQLGATPLMVMAQLRYLAHDGRLSFDRKQIEMETGFSRKTVKTTLQALLPESLGYCGGLGAFDISDDGVFRVEFRTADSIDPSPLVDKMKPLILVGWPGMDDDGDLAEAVEDDPTLHISFDDPYWYESQDKSTKELTDSDEPAIRHSAVAGEELPETRAFHSADTRRSVQASLAPLPTSPTVAAIVNDADETFVVIGEMPEDRTVEDDFSDADLPEELLA
jgi:hypothetical protein